MASLTGTKIKDTYDSILKVSDNGAIDGTLQTITDGVGNNSSLSLSTAGASVGGTLAVTGDISLAAGGKIKFNNDRYFSPENNVDGAEISANGVFKVKTGATPTERMRIDSSGNVGIGGTADSWAKLDVNGQSLLRGNAVLKIGQALKFNNYFNAGTSTNKIVDDGYAGAIYLNAADGSIIFGNSSSSVIGGADVSITERVRILSSGGLTFNGDTSTANALDDYEEGTFTPTFAGAITGGTYVPNNLYARYTKIGNQVTVQVGCNFAGGASGGSGSMVIFGLPFAYSANSIGLTSSFTAASLTWSGSYLTLLPTTSASASDLVIGQISSASGYSFVQASGFGTSTDIRFTLTYFV